MTHTSNSHVTYEEQFRAALLDALERELVGPDLPPHGLTSEDKCSFVECLEESPTQRYSAGVLFPQSQPLNEIDNAEGETWDPEDDVSGVLLEDEQAGEASRAGVLAEEMADAYDETVRLANEFLPSAIGLSCLCEIPESGIVIRSRAARYQSQKATDPTSRENHRWQRRELTLPTHVLWVPQGTDQGMQSFSFEENLQLRAIYRHRGKGVYLLTLSLINTNVGTPALPVKAADCFFQVGLSIESVDGQHIFHEYRAANRVCDATPEDPDAMEEAVLELLYRNRKAFAVGHGTSVDWGGARNGKVNRISTVTMPRVKVPPIEPRHKGGNELSMYFLSGADGSVAPASIPSQLNQLANDYESWLDKHTLEDVPPHLHAAAELNLSHCRECLARIRRGIGRLSEDPVLLEAFMLANQAMLMQQVHSRRPKRATKQPLEDLPRSYRPRDDTSGRWRTFQLAFILMNLNSIAPNPDGTEHADRNLVDLIWFPTGGGKTEAYLGLAAVDIFYRRLVRPSNAGCTVLMRYTLRLLTSQQFQRASSMICACEMIRRSRPQDLGDEPISIGLWVGESLTPLWRAAALESLHTLARQKRHDSNAFQLLKCPWCGTALDEHDNLGYVADGRPRTVIFVCPEKTCPFSTRRNKLPVVVIDEDIYDSPPTLIIGTVDKFAMLAWRPDAGRLFGIGTDQDYDPPDLIIQDELHLISGPLGSVVGLYETAIDLLCSRKGRRPKLVASTATIRRAWRQCKSLYNRNTALFPPQGLDIADSFFAKENSSAAGRVYAGVFASASPSFVTALVRTLGGLFQACSSLNLPDGANETVRDPYWTILQYFNSLRELGHAATLIEADIPEYMWAIASRMKLPKEVCRSLGPPAEMTSRRTAAEIPEILERLEVRYPRRSEDPKDRPLDTLLATNMISVGVDVDRLGLMVVVGQPKTTSEYIQATSRVGRSRSAPGLVIAMYNPGKPRDRSHYEHFRAYHEAFYKCVEPTSVTPFALPVIERALHAVLVILARHYASVHTPTSFDPMNASIVMLTDFIRERCAEVDAEHAEHLAEKLQALVTQWAQIRPGEWGRFGRPPEARPLMYPAGSDPLAEWGGSPWATPTSMRTVDVECEARVIATYSDTQ